MENNREFVNTLEVVSKYYKKESNAKISVFTNKNSKYNEYIKKYKVYYGDFREIILRDVDIAISKFDTKKDSILRDIFYLIDNNFEDEELIHIVIDLHIFYRLFEMKHYSEKPLSNINDIIGYDEEDVTIWYRGQTNTNWQLVPSFFRSAKKTALWTWDEIYKDYKSKPQKDSLIEKLNKANIDTNNSPYNTAAFIQHSIGYSPLIDFSKSSKVALSFALSNGSSMVSYYGDDACVYELKLNKTEILENIDSINDAISKSKVQVFMEYDIITNLITNEMWQNLLNDTAQSVIHLINKPTNDRMMFQKGTFILYDNTIIIGDKIFMSFDKASFIGSRLTKYNIQTTSKEKLYKQLMSDHPQYHQRYLLNPYLYLSELDK